MYLVTGATGAVGRRVVQQLRDRGDSVRAFVRLTARYSALESAGAEIFIGDLRNERDIRKACQGIRYIISAHGGGRDAQSVDYRANVDLIDCARENGAEHFTFISVLGADRNYEDAPTFKAKREVEKYLRSSGLGHTILQPSGLASSLIPLAKRFQQTGIYILIGEPQNRTSIVSADDLAKMAALSSGCEAARDRTFPVGGPDILKREDIPRLFGRLYGKEPILVNIPLPIFDGARGAIQLWDPELGGGLGTLRTLLAREFFCTREQVAALEATYGFELESVEAFLRRYDGVSN